MVKKKKANIGTQRSAYLFILPSAIILAVFVFVPLIASFIISLLNIDVFMRNVSFAGLANFKKLITDTRAFNDTFNTIYFTVLEVPLQIITALIISTFVANNTRLNQIFRTIFYLPFICSLTAIGIVFSMLLDPNMGWLPYLLNMVGLGGIAFLKDAYLAMPTLIVISVWKNFGYTMTLLTAAIIDVPGYLYEAAEIDGAGYWKKFMKITVPGIWPTICFCIVTNIIASLQTFDLPYIMTKGGPDFHTETIVQYIYDRGFRTAPYSLGYASAISVYLFLIIAIITFIFRKFILNRREEANAW